MVSLVVTAALPAIPGLNACCRNLQPLAPWFTGVSATLSACLLTETRPGDVVRVPSHFTLTYVGLDKVRLCSVEDPTLPPLGAATITMDTLPDWMKRYIEPMLKDMVSRVRCIKFESCRYECLTC